MSTLRSVNILPMLAATDQRNKRFRHTVFGGDGALRHSRQGSDCYYISRAQFCASATSSVLSLVNRLKMRGIDTAPVAAKMVKLQAVRDWTYELFVDPTVRRVVNPSACNLTVSRLRQTAVPIPASGGRINRVRCVDIGMTWIATLCGWMGMRCIRRSGSCRSCRSWWGWWKVRICLMTVWRAVSLC